MCYTLTGFFNSFFIDVTDICSLYDGYKCFTLDGEVVNKSIKRLEFDGIRNTIPV